MTIDLNNVRRNLLSTYSELCGFLNNSAVENESVIVDAKTLKSHMDHLGLIVSYLAAASIEGREDFIAVGEKELPRFNLNSQ
jgi:hypothetical protein